MPGHMYMMSLNSRLIAILKQMTPGPDDLNYELYQIYKKKTQTLL